MSKWLIMLSPPRSFSSVISTMLGEHPDLYGFPELHIFTGDTVEAVIDEEMKTSRQRVSGPPGLIRTIAQLHDGIQTSGSCLRAIGWIQERRKWTTKQLTDYLADQVAPRIGIEKSPATAKKPQNLERAYAQHPDAFYLHLTRHPVSNRRSWQEFADNKSDRKPGQARASSRFDRYIGWYQMHAQILDFTRTLPLGQYLRVKGEDILTAPDLYLRQICDWLGIRTDTAAIEAMKHPETSPYACIGPDIARGGNDHKFMRDPVLRPGRVKEPSLVQSLEKDPPDWFPEESIREAASRSGLRIASHRQIADRIIEMAHYLGYT